MVVGNILRKFGTFHGYLEYLTEIWYISWQFGIFSPVSSCFIVKNLAALRTSRLSHLSHGCKMSTQLKVFVEIQHYIISHTAKDFFPKLVDDKEDQLQIKCLTVFFLLAKQGDQMSL
jgi:hypothetical protein